MYSRFILILIITQCASSLANDHEMTEFAHLLSRSSSSEHATHGEKLTAYRAMYPDAKEEAEAVCSKKFWTCNESLSLSPILVQAVLQARELRNERNESCIDRLSYWTVEKNINLASLPPTFLTATICCGFCNICSLCCWAYSAQACFSCCCTKLSLWATVTSLGCTPLCGVSAYTSIACGKDCYDRLLPEPESFENPTDELFDRDSSR